MSHKSDNTTKKQLWLRLILSPTTVIEALTIKLLSTKLQIIYAKEKHWLNQNLSSEIHNLHYFGMKTPLMLQTTPPAHTATNKRFSTLCALFQIGGRLSFLKFHMI